MSTAPATIPSPAEGQDLARVPMRFEVTRIPVSDIERAKAFYQRLGWRLDIDHAFTEQVRAVQFTPPGSAASIHLGPAGTDRLQGLLLIVEDIEAARHELVERGVEVGEIFHGLPGEEPSPGRDPEGRSYVSQATLQDPDGNVWVLQEVTDRIPGRVSTTTVEELAELLHETAERHDPYEQASEPHHWWDWYAAYMDARRSGNSPDEAAAAAGRYMAEVKHVTTRNV